jgi:hypothetical protein
MPDLWDPNPDHVFNGPGKKPDPTPTATTTAPKRCRSGTTGAVSGSPHTS